MSPSRSRSVPILDSWTQTTARSCPPTIRAPAYGREPATSHSRHDRERHSPTQRHRADHERCHMSAQWHCAPQSPAGNVQRLNTAPHMVPMYGGQRHPAPHHRAQSAPRSSRVRDQRGCGGQAHRPPPRDDRYTWHGSPERCGLPAGMPTWLQDRFAPGIEMAMSPSQYWHATNARFMFGTHKDDRFTESNFIPNRQAAVIGRC